jgi:predicted transcriptional regulator of viral defense system
MKKEIMERFNGQYCTIDEIVAFATETDAGISRKTVIWNVNDLVKQGAVTRVGRGVYSFASKPRFQQIISDAAVDVCSLLSEQFKYLDVTVTDTGALGQFMNLQPFATVVSLEMKRAATGAVLSALRKDGVDAYAKSDFTQMEKYVSSSQPFVVRAELSANPSLTQEKNIRAANLEKTLVDLVCDDDIYGQYQGAELQNIYRNATERYAVNYSQMLKYASARKKKAAVTELLRDTDEFAKVSELL